ncbi:MAG: hypothetical protein LIO42_00415 [Oscillospiraceae bacterium]|nr:hypothetical protein [Oscillospiraceae bacterium]
MSLYSSGFSSSAALRPVFCTRFPPAGISFFGGILSHYMSFLPKNQLQFGYSAQKPPSAQETCEKWRLFAGRSAPCQTGRKISAEDDLCPAQIRQRRLTAMLRRSCAAKNESCNVLGENRLFRKNTAVAAAFAASSAVFCFGLF